MELVGRQLRPYYASFRDCRAFLRSISKWSAVFRLRSSLGIWFLSVPISFLFSWNKSVGDSQRLNGVKRFDQATSECSNWLILSCFVLLTWFKWVDCLMDRCWTVYLSLAGWLNCRWSRLDDSSSGETPLDDLTSSFGILVLEKVQVDDSATYRCSVANSVGRSQYDVRVQVVEPLGIEVEPKDPVVNEGKSVTLTCSFNGDVGSVLGATGVHMQPNVRWYKDGQVINQWDKYQTVGRNSLRISAMQRGDQGVFQCFVYTEKESAQASTRLQLGGKSPGQSIRTVGIVLDTWIKSEPIQLL